MMLVMTNKGERGNVQVQFPSFQVEFHLVFVRPPIIKHYVRRGKKGISEPDKLVRECGGTNRE